MQAKEATRGGEVKETVALAATNNASVDYVGGTKQTRDEVISQLHSEGKLTDSEVELLEESDTVTIGGITTDFSVLGSVEGMTLVEMYRQAESDGCENADGTCTREDHLHIGDYVDYPNPTSGEYTVLAGELGVDYDQTYLVSQNQLNWRVLGLEGTGDSAYIKLIAGSPMKKSNADKTGTDEDDPYLYMYGAKAYINAVEELNNICAMYKNETLATKAESITMDDIDKLTGVTTDELKRQYNLDAYYGYKNYGEEYSFDNQYTPESWLKGTKTTVSGKVTGYYYSINVAYEEGAPYVTMTNERIYNMLFDNVMYGGRQGVLAWFDRRL